MKKFIFIMIIIGFICVSCIVAVSAFEYVFGLGVDRRAGPCIIEFGPNIKLELEYSSGSFGSGVSNGIDVYQIQPNNDPLYIVRSDEIYPEIHNYPRFTQKPDDFCKDIDIEKVSGGYLIGSGLVYDEEKEDFIDNYNFRNSIIKGHFNKQFPNLKGDFPEISLLPDNTLDAGTPDLYVTNHKDIYRGLVGLYKEAEAVCYNDLEISYTKQMEHPFNGSYYYDHITIARVEKYCYTISEEKGEFNGVEFIK